MPRKTRRTYPDLRTYFAESGDTQTAFGERLKRPQSWVSRVVNGVQEPSLDEALTISRLAGVPIESLIVRRIAECRS
jgi:transcriptional regulator with XRE-family HTH domain